MRKKLILQRKKCPNLPFSKNMGIYFQKNWDPQNFLQICFSKVALFFRQRKKVKFFIFLKKISDSLIFPVQVSQHLKAVSWKKIRDFFKDNFFFLSFSCRKLFQSILDEISLFHEIFQGKIFFWSFKTIFSSVLPFLNPQFSKQIFNAWILFLDCGNFLKSALMIISSTKKII